MNTMVMRRSQGCRISARPRLPDWQPIVPRLQRLLAAGLVGGALALAIGLTLALAGQGAVLAPEPTVRVIELPRVVVRASRSDAPQPAAPACPVPTDTSDGGCPLPVRAPSDKE